MLKENEVWKHYEDYLKEATGFPDSALEYPLKKMKERVSEGCSRGELKELMRAVFDPVTIMQNLEQWQNQMDILLRTGLKELSGKSRYDYYGIEREKSPYTMGADDIEDDPAAETHIYNLSAITQDMLHIAAEEGRKDSSKLIREVMEASGLKDNWEIQMLLGDCLRQEGKFDQAIHTYEKLWENNGHSDWSIRDAIEFTEFVRSLNGRMTQGDFDDWLDLRAKERGQGTVRRTERKISRNEPCPCGSGKKYKNCCGRRA